ncbi:UTP--glucose-1-phosphate uridylyltransferase [Salinicoccus albus]|uniref:UTP--glucose-1-phosphate uridylyltransferase n=1 Tax=Salinicoccus albus TaxID=418756 RepID=UPI0003675D88|nr:UTP--glucose-1-phosphate uridylyltransferase [Salinicoccus albus]
MIIEWIPQFERLEEGVQKKIQKQFENLPLDEIEAAYKNVYVTPKTVDMATVEEVPYVTKSDIDVENSASLANDAMKSGAIAVVLMAGGQGTRLEHPGPKGTFSFDGRSLFELQADQIRSKEAEAGQKLHWYIMTSDINHHETLEFFKAHHYFQLDEDQVHFFCQEHFPPLSKEGHLLLTENYDVILSPNGNGGIFNSLAASGMIDDMKSRGIRHVFMNNVDNTIVKVLDPLLVGIHIEKNNDVTSKSILPEPGEKVGRLSLVNGEKSVAEYTELPEGEGERFKNGNIGVHVFSLPFLEKAAAENVPYHLALKKLVHLDHLLNIEKREVLKFEKFYFDAFKYTDKHMTLQVDRKGEFSPLKNKTGKDSIETAYRDLKDEGII